ncbi:hypothetical protein C3L33_21186, partial [Rhododendron williamsianum]
MGSAAVEKTEEELRKEIEELNRQRWEITERLRDPRGLRRGGLSGPTGPRNFAANGGRQRGFVRPAERNDVEEQPPAKRRLSSAIVKRKDSAVEVGSGGGTVTANLSERKPSAWSRRDGNQRPVKMDFDIPPTEHVPRVLPKDEDPSLVKRNKRMLGQLLGTLRKEDMQLAGTEAYMRRSDSLQREAIVVAKDYLVAEQRSREESERLRQQEREQIAEKRRRDLTLRARVAAKAEEKKLELLFLRWSEHHRKLGNFQRTKAEPSIYYSFSKPMDVDATLIEQQKEQNFQEWKAARREELSEYQKQIGEQYLANVEKELERTGDPQARAWPQDTEDPGRGENEDEDDVEDINVGEDDLMDDVLGVGRGDEAAKAEAGNVE